MGHANELWKLLKPMGPYRSRGVYSGGELDSEGAALDAVGQELELLEREAFLDTAESFGLEGLESLLSSRPVAETPEARRRALAALLRIGGDSFTLEAINDNLKGCGLNAVVSETDQPGLVEIRFPDEVSVPRGFETMQEIIQEIVPCHLEIAYRFWCITWAQLEGRFPTWTALEAGAKSWAELEGMVEKSPQA